MQIRLNGNMVELPDDVTTVADLIGYCGLEERVVAVEKNREVVESDLHQDTQLDDGDQVEIVQFVGGG
ncbi:MAG: sulfur carrier protein ThiS [Firmicutes bacterium]|uniref:Sulfur carrier protein n=1 Tax=Melghirimyces thermohalophilus TaxID=1236220 RepID=A0A1G6HKF6_9BACL|nr:sulfur carrier protein ThiS [Melghirimyces thermohalophilus]MDA8353872.1 sulfur carrier protein ThiS [Bacillota bacterium]SDB94643.1 sulfur carrier protein [Melghirimyces thermohalophilus]